MQSRRHLDVSGTLCPIPLVETRRVIADMAVGEVLEIEATDPLAELDLAVLCERTGHELLSVNTSPSGRVRVLIRISPGQSEDAD
jgi:tRNA 2-thiouridine synthesizing protein A